MEVEAPDLEPMDCHEDFCQAPKLLEYEGKSVLFHTTPAHPHISISDDPMQVD